MRGEWVGWGRGEREASACSHYRLRTRKRVATNIKVSCRTAEVCYTDAHTAWSSSQYNSFKSYSIVQSGHTPAFYKMYWKDAYSCLGSAVAHYLSLCALIANNYNDSHSKGYTSWLAPGMPWHGHQCNKQQGLHQQ